MGAGARVRKLLSPQGTDRLGGQLGPSRPSRKETQRQGTRRAHLGRDSKTEDVACGDAVSMSQHPSFSRCKHWRHPKKCPSRESTGACGPLTSPGSYNVTLTSSFMSQSMAPILTDSLDRSTPSTLI